MADLPTLDMLIMEPEGWQLMALAHHSDGQWYCCLRQENAAAVKYASTAQDAWDSACAEAIRQDLKKERG